MIKVLSDYILNIPFVNPTTLVVCEFFTLDIYVYTGVKNAVSPPLIYSKTIKNPAALNTSISIDISNFVAEFVPINGACWVRTEVFYNDSALVQLQSIKLASKGYSYGIEAPNQEAIGIITTGTEHKIARGQTFVFKVLAEETIVPVATITIASIVVTTAPLYTLTWSNTGSVIDLNYRYRLVGSPTWILGFTPITTSPIVIELPLPAGSYEVQVFGFDDVNSVNVFSNIFVIAIV